MKLIEIWRRLGKQPLRITQHKEAIVFVDDKEYIITGIKYDSGKFIGFETKETKLKNHWCPECIRPKVHEWIIVKDKNGKEYDYHQWIGHAWYSFVGDDESGYDGWRSDVDIVEWRYQ